jgi:hypothetical protein
VGFNSTILVLNDQLSYIEKDPERFVQEMVQQIHGHNYQESENFLAQSSVMTMTHADTVSIIAVGGNCSTVLGQFYNGGRHHTEDSQIELLKNLADKYGFRLVRKTKKK